MYALRGDLSAQIYCSSSVCLNCFGYCFSHPFDFKLLFLSHTFQLMPFGFSITTNYSFWFVTEWPKLIPDLILHSLILFIMGDFEIYSDTLKHPCLQRFNDLLNLLSLSHYVNFPSCRMGHTLELSRLLNLHQSNVLLFFPSYLFPHCETEDFSPFPCLTSGIYQLPRAQWYV